MTNIQKFRDTLLPEAISAHYNNILLSKGGSLLADHVPKAC